MSVEHKAIAALKWATAARVVVQIASWAGTLLVIRLLTPDDYGLMAKLSVVCAIAGAIAELGLGAAIVRWREIGTQELRRLYGVSLLFGAGITALVAASSPWLAQLFHDPRLTWPIAVASLQMIIGAVAIIPCSLATRDLSFASLSKIEMVAGIANIAATLLLASLGAGVWALVLGTLIGAFVRSAALLALGQRVWPLFSLQGIGEHLKFGLTLVGNRVSYFAVVQSDVLIGSQFLPTMAIGQYSVALQLATMPMAKVMGTVNQIAMPAVARQQDDLAQVRESVLKAIGILSLLAFPALWGISAVAPELVRVVLGQRWLAAVTALVILPLVVPVRMVSSVLFTTSLALGNRQLDLRNTLVTLVLVPGGFYVGAHWGMTGLCLSWLISVPLAYAVSIPTLLRLLGIRASQLASECAAPAVAAGAMYAAVAALRPILATRSGPVSLLLLVLAGAIVYFAAIALVSRRHLRTAHGFVRALLASGSPGAA